ncbi:MAG: hypothetical protein ACMG6S_01205 [Byssovorax sp.]
MKPLHALDAGGVPPAGAAILCLAAAACGSLVIDERGAGSSATASSLAGGSGGASSATAGFPGGEGGGTAGVGGTGGTGGTPDCSVHKLSVLAAKQPRINWIALDATNVYWSNEDLNKNQAQIRMVPKAGGSVTDLVTTTASPRQIAVDGTHVYWSEVSSASVMGEPSAKTTIYSIPKAGGPSAKKELAWVPGAFTTGLSVDPDRVYWSDSESAIYSVSRSGDPDTIAFLTKDIPYAFDRDGVKTDQDRIYWLENTANVMSMSRAGGMPTVIGGVPENSFFFAMDEGRIYWGDTGTGLGTGQLVSVSKDGGPLTTVVANMDGVLATAVNASCVYWTTAYLPVNELRTAPKSGGDPILIAPVEMSNAALAADESGVYWDESSTHSLMRATK